MAGRDSITKLTPCPEYPSRFVKSLFDPSFLSPLPSGAVEFIIVDNDCLLLIEIHDIGEKRLEYRIGDRKKGV